MTKKEEPEEILDVKKLWPERIERLLRVRRRIDTPGMTRPPRNPGKRKFLEETGQQGPFVEGSEADDP